MAAVFLSDPDRTDLVLAAVHGMSDAHAAGLAAAVQDASHPFRLAATNRTADMEREGTMADGTAFVGAYLPLVVTSGGVDVTLGSIGLGWTAPHELSAADHAFIETLADVAALAVDRSRLSSTAAERSEWFERMAHTDALTGLANERTVARILELELARAARQGTEVSLALFDIDDFRATNASEGADVGDDVLRRVAAVLAESVRLVDTVGRIGGDEFVVVAPGSAGAVVAQRVARWRRGDACGRRAPRHGLGRRGTVPGRWLGQRNPDRGGRGRPGASAGGRCRHRGGERSSRRGLSPACRVHQRRRRRRRSVAS